MLKRSNFQRLAHCGRMQSYPKDTNRHFIARILTARYWFAQLDTEPNRTGSTNSLATGGSNSQRVFS